MAPALSYAQACRQGPVPKKVGLQVPHEAADVMSESVSTQGDDSMSAVSSSCSSSPRESSRICSISPEESTSSRVVVKSTFIDLDDETSLKVCYRRLRKTKTDTALLETDSQDELDVYEPGKFSDKMQARVQQSLWIQSQEVEQQEAMAEALPTSLGAWLPFGADTWEEDGRTTLMMRNLPNNYTREMLLAMLDDQGFAGCYDFIYLPCDFERSANLGYAFVNMVDSRLVDGFWNTFDGFSQWELPTAKVCQVRWSGPHQGLQAHIDRYRNSPVMHKSVPDDYKPVIFASGVRQTFPPPTKRIKAPSRMSSR